MYAYIYGYITDINGLFYIMCVIIEMIELRGLLSGVKFCGYEYQLSLAF